MYCIQPQTLQYWYKNYLSDYYCDIKDKKWCSAKIETQNKNCQTIEKPLYVFKEEHLGENMSIDDKAIKHEGFTILSNHDTGKIAMMLESTRAQEVEAAISLFGKQLNKIKNITMDMSPTYALVFNNLMPRVTQIIDKFHVMKYVYDAVSDVRVRIKKELTAKLTKGKKKTKEDIEILYQIEHLRRIRHAITQSPEKWSEEMKKNVNHAFEQHNDLKIAYQISQTFKQWYDYSNNIKSKNVIGFELWNKKIIQNLHKWCENAKIIKEYESVVKMIYKHQTQIINFFKNGLTNANAERLNGKIERFVSNNYGIKNKNFSLYRIANYFA
jgi:transposase